MKINNYWIGTLKAGQADFEGWKSSDNLSQVHDDGSIYFYDFTQCALDEIIPEIETAFSRDATDWTITITQTGPVVRVDFD